MSIYLNPKRYAEVTHTTLEQAKIRCDYFRTFLEKTEVAKICPKCKASTLEFECGSYEEGYGDYIRCENDQIETKDEEGDVYYEECNFTSDVTEEFIPLTSWYGFDVILMFAYDIEQKGMKEFEKELGCSWTEFVDNTTKKDCA